MIFWIASYPKSGNTWLRSLLASYYFSKNGEFDQLLLKNIRQFPEDQFFKDFSYNPKKVTDTSKFWIPAQEKINLDNKIKFFKTHNILGSINGNNFTNKKNTLGAIYVVRDPRNVITSIKNHYDHDYEGALNFILNEQKYIYESDKPDDFSNFQFISSWEKNYLSWKSQNLFPFKIIKYEDLLNETFFVVREIIEFINKTCNIKDKFDKLKAKNSIQTTNFSVLKNMEKKHGFIEAVMDKKKNKKIPFFHLGADNDWKKILNQNYQYKLNFSFNKSMKELGYI
jgi:hypothetical protein